MNPFLEKLSEGLRNLPQKKKALVAVSGGRDSMGLLHGLLALGYCKLIVCHINHQLRGTASEKDEIFVREQVHQLNLPLEFIRTDTRQFASHSNLSLETAARQLRYSFFTETALRTESSVLLLAHHAEDQLETCWWNFLRGTGTAGLAGMRQETIRKIAGTESTLHLIRPLLQVSRLEIAQFVSEKKILFREDATNADTTFTRNRIRHELLPFLDQKFGSSHREAVLRCAEILAEEEDWMRKATEALPCESQLFYKDLLIRPLALQRRILYRWLIQQGVPEVGFVEVERVRSLITAPTSRPAKVNLPAGLHARRRAGILFLEKNNNNTTC